MKREKINDLNALLSHSGKGVFVKKIKFENILKRIVTIIYED